MLFDTYAWVEFFKNTAKGQKAAALLRANACFTSVISLAELSEWIEREGLDRKRLLGYVKAFSTVLEADVQTMELAGILKVKKRVMHKDFGLVDAIILAASRQHQLPVVTGDPHFEGENTMPL
ncbi:MAG: PIN domain-containing protein [Candidatus Diapherotrites archaeon]|nr:PIN domain-containing protein [Candidatus Diapherotrites archaeon]